MKLHLLTALLFISLSILSRAQDATTPHAVKIPTQELPKSASAAFAMGTAVDPAGNSITVTPQCLLMNGKPVIPVMGEIHFSRLPEAEWERELLKMKAGGVTIVSTYVFWIHHEEIEGKYNWAGQRNLRRFIETCKGVGLPVVLRIGPWAHGECRNGGFPEWLVTSGVKLRNDDPAYLGKVRSWFAQLFNQAKGLLWKDGGNIIGIQLENEYSGRWEHLVTLKNMAKELGFDVPLYTRTGWPKLATPATFGEILPLFGDYPDGFWDRKLTDMPGDFSKAYLFRSFRSSTVIATEQLPKQSENAIAPDLGYPYLTCELGGGMMPSYHRRINIAPMDVYAMAMVRVGSGSNLPGYYMYHGGTNPDGEQTTLNEEQATKFTNYNDLPVKTYDFQAPLGEFGQANPQYHLLRRMHLFLQDFGDELALMSPFFPEDVQNPSDTASLRWNVRSDGHGGYVFVNNYQRLQNSPAKEKILFTIELPDEKISFPAKPVTIPANSSFFMPFNLKLDRVLLKYTTAQPIAKLREGGTLTVFFAQNATLPADFVFDAKGTSVEFFNGNIRNEDGRISMENLKPGPDVAIRLRADDGSRVQVVLLDEKISLQFWKGGFAGKEHAFVSESGLTFSGNELELTDTTKKMAVAVYPGIAALKNGKGIVEGTKAGLFTRYEISTPSSPVNISWTKVAQAGPFREIRTGIANVAESPKDSAFAGAAVWRITLPQDLGNAQDVHLRISYTGDVARLYAGNKLLDDNFYNGKPFEIGIRRFAKELSGKNVLLKILPLQKGAPIYLQESSRPRFNTGNSALLLSGIEAYAVKHIKLTAE